MKHFLEKLEIIENLPEDNSGVRFFGKLPNPELPLAIDPANDPLENSSAVRTSVLISSTLISLCFTEGDGLKDKC